MVNQGKCRVWRMVCMMLLWAWTAQGDPERKVPSEEGQLHEEEGLVWYEAHQLALEGQGWEGEELESAFDRLPARAKGKVRDAVWNLSKDSAGLCVRFRTDSPEIHARWILSDGGLSMPHMPATGVSGLDLYVRDEQGSWRWLATGRPAAQDNKKRLVGDLPVRMRDYCIYLPLYNGLEKMYLGFRKEAGVEPLIRPQERAKPIVFYGTSITQGGCASRTGMVHCAILGRRLDRPVINLGFSGNGRMEASVAQFLADLDPAVYVIDCLPNIKAEEVAERTAPLVRILRDARPETPIVLAEDRTYGHAFLVSSARKRNDTSRAALRKAFEELKAEGVADLHYLPGEMQLGEDNLGTVDGSHPTDLGFIRMADAFEKVLRPILED